MFLLRFPYKFYNTSTKFNEMWNCLNVCDRQKKKKKNVAKIMKNCCKLISPNECCNTEIRRVKILKNVHFYYLWYKCRVQFGANEIRIFYFKFIYYYELLLFFIFSLLLLIMYSHSYSTAHIIIALL